MARIEQGWHKVQRVPEGTIEERYIYDDGDYPVVDTSDGKDVFEGGFRKGNYHNHIVSPEWLAKLPDGRRYCALRRFKLL